MSDKAAELALTERRTIPRGHRCGKIASPAV